MRRLLAPIALPGALAACCILLLGGCEAPVPRDVAANSSASRRELRLEGNPRDLSQDEAAGGHTLRKHVGRSDDQLRERLRHERNISAASTWTDRSTAEHAIGTAITQNHEKINRWLERSGGHPNLVIDYDGDSAHPVGRSLRRDADQPQPCAHATIVLKWTGPDDYYVLTAYPECRA
jgi:hypothetical protein